MTQPTTISTRKRPQFISRLRHEGNLTKLAVMNMIITKRLDDATTLNVSDNYNLPSCDGTLDICKTIL